MQVCIYQMTEMVEQWSANPKILVQFPLKLVEFFWLTFAAY